MIISDLSIVLLDGKINKKEPFAERVLFVYAY